MSSDSIEDPKEESLYVAGIQGNLGLIDLLVYLLESIIAGIIDDLPTNEESYPDQEEGEIILYSCNLTWSYLYLESTDVENRDELTEESDSEVNFIWN